VLFNDFNDFNALKKFHRLSEGLASKVHQQNQLNTRPGLQPGTTWSTRKAATEREDPPLKSNQNGNKINGLDPTLRRADNVPVEFCSAANSGAKRNGFLSDHKSCAAAICVCTAPTCAP
jgi:hypothetical protein